jgi:hypothetical protein
MSVPDDAVGPAYEVPPVEQEYTFVLLDFTTHAVVYAVPGAHAVTMVQVSAPSVTVVPGAGFEAERPPG